VTKEDKLKLIDTIQKTTEKYITQANDFTETLKSYRTDMQTFLEAVTKTATDLDKEIQKQIEDVQGKITVATLELKKYQAQLLAAGVGLGAAVFAGAVGVWAALAFGGPLGPAIAVGVVVVALIGAAISIGFMVNAAIKINEKEKEIAELNGQLDDLLKKQEDIKKMLTKVNEASDAIKDVASYTQGFSDLWGYIKNQLTFIHKAIEQWNGDMADLPEFVEDFLPEFAQTLKPYFQNISDVMEAYVNNFP